jgi:hypothetical protein
MRHELIPPTDGSREDSRAIRAETRSNLLAAIAKAGAYLDDLVAGRVLDIAEIAAREQRSVRSALMLLMLAFLAPELVTAIVERRLPRGIGLTQMMDLPADWAEQHKLSACIRTSSSAGQHRKALRSLASGCCCPEIAVGLAASQYPGRRLHRGP